MKTWKLWTLLLCLVLGACDDNEKIETGTTPTTEANRVAVSFEQEAKTVLKNSGLIQIPVVLAKKADGEVKITVGVKQSSLATTAKEGIDFRISEKVINIPAGTEMGFVSIELLDDGKTDGNKEFELAISGAYGYGKPADTKQTCKISIFSNSFAEFEKPTWTTWESAATEGASAEWKASCRVPLIITGEISTPSTIVIQAVDSSAHEYYHFTVVSKEITVKPGDTKVYVDLLPVDDDIANDNRLFNLIIKEIKGGNLVMGKNNLNCEVTIVSEEVKKTIAFETTTYTEFDNVKTLEIPVVIDKVPEEDVIVTLAPTAKSTAVEGVDYELTAANRTLTIGESKRANVTVKLLGDNIVNGKRQLILGLRSVKGANAYLSETESLCTIDIVNDDFPTFEKNMFEVEEGLGAYSVKIAIPAVNKNRVVKFKTENNESRVGTYFQNIPSEVTIPANATEVNFDLTIGINIPGMASVTPVLKIDITEIDGFVLDEPVKTELQVIGCEYRKLIGDWEFKIGSYDGNGVQETNHVVNMTVSQGEFNKTLICKVEFLKDWGEKTFTMDYDPNTKNASWRNNKPIYEGIAFSLSLDFYLKFEKTTGGWSNYKESIPLIYNSDTKTYKWNVAQIHSDAREAGTDKANGTLWFIFKDISMKKK